MAKSGTRSSDISKAARSRSRARSAAPSAGSSRRGARVARKDESIAIVSRSSRGRGKTDWKAVDALTDAQIEAAIARDPDWQDMKGFDWSDVVLVVPPRKRPISIRVDEDVLAYYKAQGAGYQRRMNAVLRSYMQQNKSRKRT